MRQLHMLSFPWFCVGLFSKYKLAPETLLFSQTSTSRPSVLFKKTVRIWPHDLLFSFKFRAKIPCFLRALAALWGIKNSKIPGMFRSSSFSVNRHSWAIDYSLQKSVPPQLSISPNVDKTWKTSGHEFRSSPANDTTDNDMLGLLPSLPLLNAIKKLLSSQHVLSLLFSVSTVEIKVLASAQLSVFNIRSNLKIDYKRTKILYMSSACFL